MKFYSKIFQVNPSWGYNYILFLRQSPFKFVFVFSDNIYLLEVLNYVCGEMSMPTQNITVINQKQILTLPTTLQGNIC